MGNRFVTRFASRLKRPNVRAVALRVVAVVVVITAVYLALANILLQTGIVRNLVSSGPDCELEYESAYSLWPGRARFKGLELSAQDYNVQFALRVESGVVDVSLHELVLKRFRAVSLRAEGISFRFRHKLSAVGDDNRLRVAAYPPIEGYPDPPLYPGPKPPSDPEAIRRLWQVAIEDIDATLSELWMQEYRYVGPATVRGGFRLAPARSFQVDASSVAFEHGEVTLGDRVVTRDLAMNVSGQVDHTDTTADTGAGMFKTFSLRLDLQVLRADASIGDVYLGPDAAPRVVGHAALQANVSLTAGRLEPTSRATIELAEVSVSTPHGRVIGDVSASLNVLPPETLELVTTSSALRFENESGHKAPTVEAARFELRLAGTDLTQPATLTDAVLKLPKLSVPSLGWSNPLLQDAGVEVGGRLDGEATLGFMPSAGPSAHVRLRLLGGDVQRRDFRAAFAGHISVDVKPEGADDSASTGSVAVELDGIKVGHVPDQTKPFTAAVRTTDLKIALRPEPRVSGTVAVHAAPADPLLSLVLGSSVLVDLAAGALDLERLDASAKMSVSLASTRLELSQAESGALKGRGYWQRPAVGESSGAFLVTSSVANVGLILRGSETETALFVPDDWLPASGAPRASSSGHTKAKRRGAAPTH